MNTLLARFGIPNCIISYRLAGFSKFHIRNFRRLCSRIEFQGSNIEFFGLDPHCGFNLLKDSLSERIGGKRADYVLFHPPYFSMIPYSNSQWGTEIYRSLRNKTK